MDNLDWMDSDLVARLYRARAGDPELAKPLASRYPKKELNLASRRRPDVVLDPMHPAVLGAAQGIQELAGMPADLWSLASKLKYSNPWMMKKMYRGLMGDSGQNLESLITGEEEPMPLTSEWIQKKVGNPTLPEDSTLTEKLMFNIPRFGIGFAGGGALAKLKALQGVPGAKYLLGEGVGKMARIGALSGGGMAIGEEYGGPLGAFAGAFAAPMAAAGLPKMIPKMGQILRGETGAVSMTPRAISQAWQKTAGSRIMGLGERLGDTPLPFLSPQSRFAKWMGGNTLNEWLLPPQERMEGSAARMFRATQAEAERSMEALRNSALQAKNLNLEEREALREVLKYNFDVTKAPAHLQQKIQDILRPVEEAKAISKQKLYPTKRKDAQVRVALDKGLMKLFAEDVQDPLWQVRKQYGGTKFDLRTEKGTLEFLDDVLRDPAADDKIKTIARDYYDVQARTAEEVAHLHRKVYDNLLSSNIVNSPNLAVPKTLLMQAKINNDIKEIERLTKNFVEMPGNKKFQGLLVEKNVAEGLRDLEVHVTNFRRGWNKYFLNPWKFMKIGLNAPARLRDLYSNFMFNDIYGKNPLSPFRVDVYGGALNDLRKAAKGQKIPELERYFYHTGGKIDALNSVATDPIFAAMKHDANPIDNALGWLYKNPVSKFSSNLMKNTDLWSKYAKFKHNLASGMKEEEAIFDAMRSTGNMLEQPRAVRNVRDTMMPFFGWTAHSLKTIAHGMANHPVRTMKWYLGPMMAGQYAVHELGMSDEEWTEFKETLPDYMKHEVMGIPTRIPMPYRDEKGRIQMMDIAWWTPGLQDLSELSASADNPMKFMQNPAFTLGASLLMNKKFSGAPIYQEWDDESVKWAKRLGYTMQQLMPPLTPGVGNQSQKIWEAFKGEDPDALTVPQALGTQIGMRITPVDQQQQWEKKQKRLQAWENEAAYQMREELGKTQDPAEQEEIEAYYLKVMERLQLERQGGE